MTALTHHAYLLEGNPAELPEVAALLSKSERYTEGDPNLVVRAFQKFGIDDARELKEMAALRTTGGRALFIIAISSVTSEAQQALLKLFEEPQEGVVFVLLVPHGMLLPTLRSRFMTLPLELPQEKNSKEAKQFLTASNKERSDMIAKLLKNKEGANAAAREFLNELEKELHSKLSKGHAPDIMLGLESIASLRQYLFDRSPSLKMILEHLAAALPKL